MRRVSVLLVSVALVLFIPAFLAAQMHGGSGQHMMGPGMMNNLGMMSGMMGDMHQMLQSGQMTPEQQQQMLGMMNQMGGMMQQMCGPQGAQMQGQHQQQLQQMQKRLQEMKGQMKKK